MNQRNKIFIAISVTGLLISFGTFKVQDYWEKNNREKVLLIKSALKNNIKIGLNGTGELPEKINFKNSSYKVDYSLNENYQKFLKKLLKRYPSDHSSIVILDNKSGSILAMAGYSKRSRKFDYNLPVTNNHPSASLFKIITSADLLENERANPATVFNYIGRGSTLYKYQLKEKFNRWTRFISLQKAFEFSNNVIFGKAAINHSNGTSLFAMAERFGFNENLMWEIDLPRSKFAMPENQYNLAELASGFNKKTLISPLHAASLASIIANKGFFKLPHLVTGLTDIEGNDLSGAAKIAPAKKILSDGAAFNLKSMMEGVVKRGTARSIWRGLTRKQKKDMVIGAKTGSITGGKPMGKRDWLVFYAMPKGDALENSGISVSVMNINIKKWYVKSSFLAKKIIQFYHKESLKNKGSGEVAKKLSQAD